MSTHILLVGAPLSLNFGGPSMFLSVRKVLSEVFPGATFSLMSKPQDWDAERRLAERYGVDLLPVSFVSPKAVVWGALRRFARLLPRREDLRAAVQAVERADIIVDIWGIWFADTLGSNAFYDRLIGDGLHMVLGKTMGKPVVKFTADLGPFNEFWNRFFARLYLKRFFDLVFARDQVSYDSAKALGVRTPMRCVPDTAFLLDPAESDQSRRLALVRREHPIVGISVSRQAYNRAPSCEGYIEATASLARRAIETGAHVVLLPNELHFNRADQDDEGIAKTIEEQVRDGHCETMVTREMPGEEIKGVIAQFDATVAARYHSIIAALSLGVPVLAIGWHHKYEGVLSRFGLTERLCTVTELSTGELVGKFDRLWAGREGIAAEIARRLPGIKEEIRQAAAAVRTLLPARNG
ncbi:MAG: polysaccharide pyruvyl transferase family protein [Planctomycetota bacterium]